LEDFKSISVTQNKNKKLNIVNPTSYKLIGHGVQGAVFQLTPEQCVKIFALEKQAKREIENINELDGLSFVPKIYETGPNYIVMEYLEGVTLRDYLSDKKSLNESLTKQIVAIAKEMKRFNKTDIELHHIIVTNEEELKKIDYSRRHAVDSSQDAPHKLFKLLKKLQLLNIFMNQVKEIDPLTYSEWKKKEGLK